MVLQEDLIEIYNNLLEFNKTTILSDKPRPIHVKFDKNSLDSPLVFTQGGITVRLRLPLYYCLNLESLVDGSYLLPSDYDYLMDNLQKLIADDRIINERTHVSPENNGFDIYAIDLKQPRAGLGLIGTIRFVSGNSWVFKLIVKLKYKELL